MDEGRSGRPREGAAREMGAGVSMLDVLALPDGERQVVQWVLRQNGAAVSEVAAHIGQDEAAAAAALESLTARGFLERLDGDGEVRWRARITSRRAARNTARDVWKALED